MSFRGERLRLEPVPYYSYYEEIPWPTKRAVFSLLGTERVNRTWYVFTEVGISCILETVIFLEKQNFITTGNINRVILTIATPLMINNLIRTLYNLTDGLYVAQLSAEDFAATAFIWPLNFLFISLGMGISVGATALIAQYFGAGQPENAKRYAGNAIVLTYFFGFLLSVIGYFCAPYFVGWMGADGLFYEKSVSYLKINFVGLFFDFCYFGYQSLLNAQGRTRTITMISAASSISNVILDPIFIFATIPVIGLPGLNWGIEGAGWATVIAKVLLLLLAIRAVRSESEIQIHLKRVKIENNVMMEILKVAWPSAFGYGGAALGFTVLNGLIQSYGTSVLAAYSMVNRISDLLTQPQMGIGAALTAIIGQNMGAKLYDRAHAIFRRALLWILMISTIGCVIVFIFQSPILGVFIKDRSDVVLWDNAVEYLNYTAFIIFFMGLFSSYNGFFQGCGVTKYSMNMSVGRLWVLRLPIIWVLGAFTTLGATSVWIAMLLSNALTVLYGHIVYITKDWSALHYAKGDNS